MKELADRSRPPKVLRIRGLVSGAVAVIAGLALTAYLYHTRSLSDRLLRADPDSITANQSLVSYADPRGREGYEQHCAACHKANLQGDPAKGVPNLVDADWLYGSGRIGEIERIVLYGIRSGNSKAQNLADMPAFATPKPYARYRIDPLKPRELDDIAKLVYSFQHPHDVDAQTIARGTDIYRGKGYCFDCHTDQAKGDPAIGAPNLTDAIWLYGSGSLDDIKREIALGLAGRCPPWIGRLPAETIREIAVYVHLAAQRAIHRGDSHG